MNLRLLPVLVLALAGAGCESVSDATTAVRERIAAREAPTVRTYAAQPRATYEAVRTAATQMGYRMTRGGAAQGEFEAVRNQTTGAARLERAVIGPAMAMALCSGLLRPMRLGTSSPMIRDA